MTARMKDIAELVGVSLTTVSKVLKAEGDISVSKETEEKIWAAAQQIGYKLNKTNNVNRNRGKKRIKNIGYILQVTKERFNDPFFSQIIHGIEREIIDQRMNRSFMYTVYDLEDHAVMHEVLTSNVDGLILIGSVPKDLYKTLVKKIPHSLAIFSVSDEDPIDCITLEYEQIMFKLVRQLILGGHERIAYIGGTSDDLSCEESEGGIFYHHDERYQGYLKALIDSGIPIRNSIIKDGNWDIETAYQKMLDILASQEQITAVVAANDRMAIGAMRAIQEQGFKIPEDISIVGFDDIETAKYMNPPLTSVFYPKEEIGRLAVKVLLESMSATTEASIPKKFLIHSRIINRQSVRNLRETETHSTK